MMIQLERYDEGGEEVMGVLVVSVLNHVPIPASALHAAIHLLPVDTRILTHLDERPTPTGGLHHMTLGGRHCKSSRSGLCAWGGV